jgi:glycosyltransferase involved in cell wall biosynthesis
MRIIALLATYNEQRFIGNCLRHLLQQGLEVYLIDNESGDATREIAREFLGKGLLHIETFPRDGMYCWRPLLQRKARLAQELEADWFMHVDADEIRLAPPGHGTLQEAFRQVAEAGYNAVNFQEFTFTPVAESPDHDHPDYLRTLRWYYPFSPHHPHQVKAWRKTAPIDLDSSGGHQVQFADRRIYPIDFIMKHYLFLSPAHAIEKYARKLYDPREVAVGWHGDRARLGEDQVRLPEQAQMREIADGQSLDASHPRVTHLLFEPLQQEQEAGS